MVIISEDDNSCDRHASMSWNSFKIVKLNNEELMWSRVHFAGCIGEVVMS